MKAPTPKKLKKKKRKKKTKVKIEPKREIVESSPDPSSSEEIVQKRKKPSKRKAEPSPWKSIMGKHRKKRAISAHFFKNRDYRPS